FPRVGLTTDEEWEDHVTVQPLTAAFIVAVAGLGGISSAIAATTYQPITILFSETACLRAGGTVAVQNRVRVCALADVTVTRPTSPSQAQGMKLPYEDDPKAGEPTK